MIHGKNTHQLQVISSQKAKVLDKDLLHEVMNINGWGSVFDMDLYTNDKDHPMWLWNKYTWYPLRLSYFPTHFMQFTMRSPQSIHLPLLTGSFSAALTQALERQPASTVKTALGLTEVQDVSEGIEAIRTLEDYTRYRHFQMQHQVYQTLLASGGCISFRDFIQDQYQHKRILNLGLTPIRKYAIKKSIESNLKDPSSQVFGIRESGTNATVHAINGSMMSEKMFFHAFIVLKKASNGAYYQKVLEILKEMSNRKEPLTKS
ncbi:MAG: hypothetical protein ACR2PX_08145 [Endozoicomonas sp.]